MMRSLLRAAQQARRRSPRELWTRAAQRALAVSERGQLLMLGIPTAASQQPSPARHPATATTSELSSFFPGVTAADATVAALRLAAPEDEAAVLHRAACIASGTVPVLGHGWIDIGVSPDWHREPLAGVRAPLRHWSRIQYLDRRVVGDHKVLWEFNRHQFFVTLGQAWRYSGDERWAASWMRYTSSWFDQNPTRVGANWASSLEVAYRAISWCWAVNLFAGSEAVPPAFLARVRNGVAAHARHVARYLSTYFSPNTHLTGEALGLYYAGVTFPDLPQSQKWRALGAEILETELQRQVHGDGVYFEQATQYHRYTTEIYLHFHLLSQAAGERRSPHVAETLHRLFDVLLALTRADGTMPLIGDDDGGRLVQLDADRPDQTRELLSAGAAALNRPDLAAAGAGSVTMATWLLGPDAPPRLEALAKGSTAIQESSGFPAGGLYVMRDRAGVGTGHATMDAGPHGALSFGHSHADALAIELFAGGGPLFVDSGTFAYEGTQRDAYRSTAAHNTVEVDGESACLPGASFKWRTVAHARCEGWISDEGLSWLRGRHEGYARLDPPATHRRDLAHPGSGVWVVTDAVSSTGAHQAVLRWHLAPDVDASIVERWDGGSLIVLTRGDRQVATLAVLADQGEIALEPGVVSPQFGHEVPSMVITWRGEMQRDLRVQSIVLDWTSLAVPAVLLHSVPLLARLAGPAWAEPEAHENALHVDGEEVDCGAGLKARASLLWVERTDGDAATRIAGVGVRSLAHGGHERWTPDKADGWFVATFENDDWHVSTGTLSPVDY